MKYIENETATCGKCGNILIKQYPQKTVCSEWFCLKCNEIAKSVTYIVKQN